MNALRHQICYKCSSIPYITVDVPLESSVDGTVRQHDIRERCKGQCQNVMLDLQHAKRNSLTERPTQRFILCSSDLSPSSKHILIGGDDRFERLFDRRFVQQKSCLINYYCPKHLYLPFDVQKNPRNFVTHLCKTDGVNEDLYSPDDVTQMFKGDLNAAGPSIIDESEDVKIKHIKVAKVAFSPHEWEVLISYNEEHIYVMSINHDGVNEDLYSPDDVTQMFKADLNAAGPSIIDESEDVKNFVTHLCKTDGVNEDLYSPDDVTQMFKVVLNAAGPSIIDESEDVKIKHINVAKVAFSPHEWEVLISYNEEHIYVMSINHGVNEDLYSPDDVTQMFKADLNAAGPSIIDESVDVKFSSVISSSLWYLLLPALAIPCFRDE
ncbi:hypothetical protein P8452_77616 [Trifolium repens]|nr:hypothetical protein P8452_77616 [Trifolium repens]